MQWSAMEDLTSRWSASQLRNAPCSCKVMRDFARNHVNHDAQPLLVSMPHVMTNQLTGGRLCGCAEQVNNDEHAQPVLARTGDSFGARPFSLGLCRRVGTTLLPRRSLCCDLIRTASAGVDKGSFDPCPLERPLPEM